MKAFFLAFSLLCTSFAFSQEKEIVNILNRELQNEIKYPLDNDPYLNGQKITIVKGFSIENKTISFTIKRVLENGYVIETRKLPLDSVKKISIIDDKIKLGLLKFNFDNKFPVASTYYYNNGKSENKTTYEFDLNTYIHFPNKKYIGYDLKKAFEKIGKNVIILVHKSLENPFDDMAAQDEALRTAIEAEKVEH